jgi:hypothetical protein
MATRAHVLRAVRTELSLAAIRRHEAEKARALRAARPYVASRSASPRATTSR